jgi:hypothetical protein
LVADLWEKGNDLRHQWHKRMPGRSRYLAQSTVKISKKYSQRVADRRAIAVRWLGPRLGQNGSVVPFRYSGTGQ